MTQDQDITAATTYSSSQVRALVGITRRQLDHWTRIGLVWPASPSRGSGHPAGYGSQDLVWIAAVARLVHLGVRPEAIGAALSAGSLRQWLLALAGAARATRAPEWDEPAGGTSPFTTVSTSPNINRPTPAQLIESDKNSN